MTARISCLAWLLLVSASASAMCAARFEAWGWGGEDPWRAKDILRPARLAELAELKAQIEQDLIAVGTATTVFQSTLAEYRKLLKTHGLDPNLAPGLARSDLTESIASSAELQAIRQRYLARVATIDEVTLTRLFWTLWHMHTVIEELEWFYGSTLLPYNVVSTLTPIQRSICRALTRLVATSTRVAPLLDSFVNDYRSLHGLPATTAFLNMLRRMNRLYDLENPT